MNFSSFGCQKKKALLVLDIPIRRLATSAGVILFSRQVLEWMSHQIKKKNQGDHAMSWKTALRKDLDLTWDEEKGHEEWHSCTCLVRIPAALLSSAILDKLLTHMRLFHQAV